MENDLRTAFLATCKRDDLTAAQVLRAFMRSYVEEKSGEGQPNLFETQYGKNEVKYGVD